MRSDQQLVALFRAGNDEAFRVIHDRYHQRLFAYTRQMLAHRQDAEDALQDIFVRAYAGLRANDRELALRAWLYRVAHNRCIDELRRPAPPPPEVIELLRSPVHDPIAEADQRESLRRLIADVRRLPDQQRSALLMRELGGMSYADMADALGVTVPAVKSLLVRARVALGQALEARDTACSEIRDELMLAHDRGRRPNSMARRHMRDCAGCREFRHDLRGVSRRFAAIVPTLGPLGVLANVLGVGGAGGGAVAGGSAAAAGGAAGTGSALVSVGALGAGAGHVATLVAAAVVTAGGAVEIQHTITPPPVHHRHHARVAASAPRPAPTVKAPAAVIRYPTAQAPTVTPPAAPQTPAVAPAGRAPATPASRTPRAQRVPSTSTVTTTTTVKNKPTGGSAATGPKKAVPKTQTVTPATSGVSPAPTTVSTTTATTTTPAQTDQTPSVLPGSAQTSTTGSTTATGGSTAPPAASQTTTPATGSPAASVSGGSSAPPQ